MFFCQNTVRSIFLPIILEARQRLNKRSAGKQEEIQSVSESLRSHSILPVARILQSGFTPLLRPTFPMSVFSSWQYCNPSHNDRPAAQTCRVANFATRKMLGLGVNVIHTRVIFSVCCVNRALSWRMADIIANEW